MGTISPRCGAKGNQYSLAAVRAVKDLRIYMIQATHAEHHGPSGIAYISSRKFFHPLLLFFADFDETYD